jgi:anthranilate phosphoribosyltransferase
MAEPVCFAELLQRIDDEVEPIADIAIDAFRAIFAGAWSPVQVAGFVVATRCHGQSAPLILAGARALRAAMVPVVHDHDTVLDTCGTGGDGMSTLNLSTAAAIVVSAAGVRVAKHGNRSASSSCGSADVLETLGLPLAVAPAVQARVLDECGIAFLYANAHHPVMKHAAQARRELGVRSVFNLLGPLANPAGATHQVLGIYAESVRAAVAEALGSLGVRRAWVVRGEDGVDEISATGPTRVTVVEGGATREMVVVPEDFGARRVTLSAIGGGDPTANAAAIRAILSGEPHPASEAVLVNAAAALAVATSADLASAGARVRAVMESGAPRAVLERWMRRARELSMS